MKTLLRRALPLFISALMVLVMVPQMITAQETEMAAGSLEAIRADDITISEGASCSIQTDDGVEYYKRYNIETLANITITYNGKEYSGNAYTLASKIMELTGQYVEPVLTPDQDQSYDNTWQVGNTYSIHVSFMGQDCDFTVTIKKSPIVSIEADEVTLIKDADKEIWFDTTSNGQLISYFKYVYYPVVTLTTEDGKSHSVKAGQGSVQYDGEYFQALILDDQRKNSSWDTGTHSATIMAGGVQKEITVKVIEAPVQSIETEPIIVYPSVTANIDAQMKYVIHFKDGTTQSVVGRQFLYNGKKYLIQEGPEFSDLKAGEVRTETVPILGYPATFEIRAYGIESAELLKDEGLTMLIHRTDGETDALKAQLMLERTKKFLYTERGILEVDCESDNNSLKLTIGGKETNTVQNTKWANTNEQARKFGSFMNYAKGLQNYSDLSFQGSITKENIDAIMTMVYITEGWTADQFESHTKDDDPLKGYVTIKADLMKKRILQKFDTPDVDLNLTDSYDPAANTVAVPDIMAVGFRNAYPVDYLEVISNDAKQGFWFNSIEYGYTLKFLFTDDYKIKSFSADEKEPVESAFQDVKDPNAWFYDTVYQIASTVNEKGHALMSGYSNGSHNFGPADPLARQDFAVILYRLANEPDIKPMANPFTDTDPSGYYYNCVLWTKAENVIAGYNDGRFGVGDQITREQVATILYRFAKDYMKVDTSAALEAGDLSKFKDGTEVSSWAKDALTWATGAGVITGKTNGTLIDARGNAARAEIGAMVLRFMNYMDNQ